MDYLVFNDSTGEFVAVTSIIAVVEAPAGACIFLANSPDEFFSPLKPRELLRRLTIMRFKRENGESTQNRTQTQEPRSTL